MSRRIVILNDTSGRSHHGCTRVMRLLTEALAARGAEILATSPARQDWAADAGFLAALERAETIVINGEGTLHHGRAHGERLLRVAVHPAAGGKRLALINALYDSNPEGWGAYLNRFTLLSARDAQSAEALSRATGQKVGWVPDLSLASPGPAPDGPRRGILIGDAVRAGQRRAIAQATRHWPNRRYLPTKTRASDLWRWPILGPVAKSALFAAYTGTSPIGRPPFDLARTEADYLDHLSAAALHVTGRFHGVCLSLLTMTPFLAVDSVSGKIGRLLDDLGLGRGRLLTPEALGRAALDHPISPEEETQIKAALADAQRRASALFDSLSA